MKRGLGILGAGGVIATVMVLTMAPSPDVTKLGLGTTDSFTSLDGGDMNVEDLHVRGLLGSMTAPDSDHQIKILMDANKDIEIDGTTNPRSIDTGVMRFEQTPSIENTRAITVNMDVNSMPNSHAVVVNATSTALAAGETVSAYDVNVDSSTSTGGVVRGFEMSIAGAGSATAHMLHADPGVVPLTQFSGTFGNIEQVFTHDGGSFVDETAAFNATGTDVTIFDEDNAYVYIGMAAQFDQIEVNLDTASSGAGIAPTFEFTNDGAGGWATFTPTDETLGFRQSGVINWTPSDLTGWTTDTVNAVGSKHWIRIKRTRNNLTTPPKEDTIQVSASTTYQWDASGDITVNNITLGDDQKIYLDDDADSYITSTAEDQLDFFTNGTKMLVIDDFFVNPTAALKMGDDTGIIWGGGNDSQLLWRTSQTPDALVLGVGTDSRGFLIVEKGDGATDFGHAQQTNPTLWIHSSDQTDTADWVSVAHDQTHGVIATGRGGLTLSPAINGVNMPTASSDPCGSLAVGAFFYSSGGFPCYCGPASADLKFSDNLDCTY